MNLCTISRVRLCVALFAGCCAVAGCKPQNSTPASIGEGKAAIEDKLRDVDAAWSKTALAHDVDGWMSYYADDAVVLPANEKTLTGKASIRPEIAGLLGMKDAAVSWKPTKIVVADSGEIAYLYGTYTIRGKDTSGASADEDGKLVEIWRRQPDGAWKCVVDGWSSDLPAQK
jgi:ketosteroid isomerase-like protein